MVFLSILSANPGRIQSYTNFVFSGLKESVSSTSNKKIIWTSLLGTLAATQMDDALIEYAQKNGLMPESLAHIGDNYVAEGWAVYSLTGGILVPHFTSGETLSDLWDKIEYAWTSIAVTNYITNGLKYSAGRERPDQTDKRSFPSGHTSHSFVVAAVSHELFGYRIGFAAYCMAGIVGLSRIHDNKHFLSDVIFGAGLGTVVGKGFGKAYRSNSKSISFGPTLDGRFQLSIRF